MLLGDTLYLIFPAQALLSDDGAVSLGLCSEEEVWQGEGVVPHLLEVLVWCPHSVWALSSVCSKLPCRYWQ